MRCFKLLPLLWLLVVPAAGRSIEEITCPLDRSRHYCQAAVAEKNFWNIKLVKKRHCNQRYLFDLDRKVTSNGSFNAILFFAFKTIKACSDNGIGRTFLFNPLGFDNETRRCCSIDGCRSILIGEVTYEKFVRQRDDSSLFHKSEEANVAYFTRLSEDLKEFERIGNGTFSSITLITDRIFTDFAQYSKGLSNVFALYNSSFSVVLVNRPEVNTTFFRTIYRSEDIPQMEVFSVSNISCLPFLATCIKPCSTDVLCSSDDTCSIPKFVPRTTSVPRITPTPTPIQDENLKWRLVYIYDLSDDYSMAAFPALKNQMVKAVDHCFEGGELAATYVGPRYLRPKWFYFGIDFFDSFKDFEYFYATHGAHHPVDDNETSTLHMVKSAMDLVKSTPAHNPPVVHTFVLITDYVSEEFVDYINQTSNKEICIRYKIIALNRETDNVYTEQLPAVNTTYMDVWNTNNIKEWCQNGFLGEGSTPKKTAKPARTSNVSTVLFISVGTCSALLIILIGCTVLYRQKFITIKKIQKFRERHESVRPPDSDEMIDYWELSWDKLVVKMEKLGSGAYGQVYRGKLVGKAPAVEKFYANLPMNKTWENCDVAIKMLPKYATEQARKEFMNEIELMKTIGYNDNIVNMLGCITVGNPVGLVLEYCSNRDMLHYLKGRKVDIQLSKSFEDCVNYTKELLSFAWQIADGMNYLGSKNVVHRDLAARNILVDAENNAKIGDFGLCMNMSSVTGSVSRKNGVFISASGRLPIKWLALECLQKHEFSSKSDVWSFGIVLYEMYTFGGVPFQGIDTDKLLNFLELGGRPEKPDLCNDEMYEIMQKCWREHPEERPTFQELLTIFTVLLERAAENYGYLSLLKANAGNQRAISRLAESFCMADPPMRREARTTTESTIASDSFSDLKSMQSKETLDSNPLAFLYGQNRAPAYQNSGLIHSYLGLEMNDDDPRRDFYDDSPSRVVSQPPPSHNELPPPDSSDLDRR
ncbi:hypothetical protein L596_011392 [Steinernema carpocapsae]|uniref:Protein kinase domain-containing protein n=1 Tax=Steinernema carpocapsae TaxID=34508 RepID=A0A4U5NUI9_STECR|nr:hypothetical protein L596_011392 [Steinernema carpocapsae]